MIVSPEEFNKLLADIKAIRTPLKICHKVRGDDLVLIKEYYENIKAIEGSKTGRYDLSLHHCCIAA